MYVCKYNVMHDIVVCSWVIYGEWLKKDLCQENLPYSHNNYVS